MIILQHEDCEDTKEVIRNRKREKDRQHNAPRLTEELCVNQTTQQTSK
jgi:hypothetical protein